MGLQEVPRAKPGWMWREIDKMGMWSYQHDDTWRGTGIAFHMDRWVVMRKLHCSAGCWFRVRHIQSGSEMWLGSVYIAPHEPMIEHQNLMRGMLSSLPATTLPTALLGDVTAPIKWSDEPTVPLGESGKCKMFLDVGAEFGFQMVPPGVDQRDQATSRPRKENVVGRQIDFCLTKHATTDFLKIVSDSCHAIGTDHDAVMVECHLRRKPSSLRRKRTGRRVVTKDIPEITSINQNVLVTLANTCTGAPPNKAYKDTEATRELFRIARRARHPHAWTRALRARQQDKTEWKEKQLHEAASGDWRSFRTLKPRVGGGWETHFADACQDRDPHEVVHEHYQKVFSGGEQFEWEGDVDPPPSPDFTEEELMSAIDKGNLGKSVGPDGVSLELLKRICDQERGRRELLAWFNTLLHTGSLPDGWLQSLMVLLPKTERPILPKETRPISMSSATEKIFSRMVLERCKPFLIPETSWQSCGPRRQTADYLYLMQRLMDTEREWGKGLAVAKIDIAKAFDTVSRSRLYGKLRDKLGWTEECRVWGRLLTGTSCLLQSPWGQSEFRTTTGIRQGAVESPILFCCVMDWVLQEASDLHQWKKFPSTYPDLEVTQNAFMDDLLMWEGRSKDLQNKITQLEPCLSRWGLEINYNKCSLYLSPKHDGPRVLRFREHTVPASPKLEVMGVAFRVGANSTELLTPVWERAKKKFWSLKHLLCSAAPLAKRLKLMHKVVGGSMLWCVAAFPPEGQALENLNRIMFQLVIYMLRLRKGSHEEWIDFRKRGVRQARQVVNNHLGKRWSTCWLERFWGYQGHVARGLLETNAPGSAIMCYHRTANWWEHQQQRVGGLRHSNRFFPKMYPLERNMDAAAGEEWRMAAMDRQAWRVSMQTWIDRMDVPWCSGQQDALMMY